MKRMLIALAAAAGMVGLASHLSADPGGFAPPKSGGAPMSMGSMGGPGTLLGAGATPDRAPDCYGFCPAIKRCFNLGRGGQRSANLAAAGYGTNGPAYNPAGYPPGAYGPAQGTLVFPNHTFVRSPRDYFMLDLNK